MERINAQWLVQFALFMAIFVGCVVSIFNPVKVDIVYGDVAGYVSFGAGSLAGLELMAKAWVNNTGYFVTVGVTGVLAIAGAVMSIRNIKEGQYEKSA